MDKVEHLIRKAYDQRDTDSLRLHVVPVVRRRFAGVRARIVKTLNRSYIVR